MKKFAVVEDQNVTNIVVSDDPDALTIISMLYPKFQVIEVPEDTETNVGITSKYINGVFSDFKPHDGWIFNEESFSWEPPTPKPADVEGYTWFWDSALQDWSKFDYSSVVDETAI